MSTMTEIFGEPISTYSRAQAIEDGVLVDVTETSERKETGLSCSVAMTRTAWTRYVEVPKAAPWQDQKGRLWDVLYMLAFALRRRRRESSDKALLFQFMATPNEGKKSVPVLSTLKAVCGLGDEGERTITVMLVDED